MAITIVTPGRLTKDVPMRGTCRRCGCGVRCMRSDIDGDWTVPCPSDGCDMAVAMRDFVQTEGGGGPDLPTYLTQDEAAIYTRLSHDTLTRHANRGERVGRVKVGGRVVYVRSVIDEWMLLLVDLTECVPVMCSICRNPHCDNPNGKH